MILSVGASYRTGSVELLERLAVDDPQLPSALKQLHDEDTVDEVLLLSTCNRVEVYASVSGRTAIPVLADWFLDRIGPLARRAHGTLRVRHQDAAVEHLLTVACGLNSMALGEEHVTAQLRHAFQRAREVGTVGPVLGELVETALRTSKKARTQTALKGARRSLVHAGLELAEKQLNGLRGRPALIVGAGTMGVLAGRLLAEAGAGPIAVASRTEASAQRVATAVGGGQVVPIDDLHSPLAAADVVVTATAAPGFVITRDRMRAARGAGDRPLFALDLAIPRDIDPGCRAVPGVTVADIADLGRHLSEDGAPPGVTEAREIVLSEVQRFVTRRQESTISPLITTLHERARADVEVELAHLHRRFPAFAPEAQRATAAAVNRIISRVLHRPTLRVKELAAMPDGRPYLEALYRIFDLEPQATTDEFTTRTLNP